MPHTSSPSSTSPTDTIPGIVIVTGPSGAGKSTIVRFLLKTFPQLEFAISATTRPPRPGEQHGREYYFLSIEEFERYIQEGAFAEYEQVYPGKYYGTLWPELTRITQLGKIPLLDIDVQGATRLKAHFGPRALTLFIHPGSLAQLRQRLQTRGTENSTDMEIRISKALIELDWARHADVIIWNFDLEKACQQTERVVRLFLERLTIYAQQ